MFAVDCPLIENEAQAVEKLRALSWMVDLSARPATRQISAISLRRLDTHSSRTSTSQSDTRRAAREAQEKEIGQKSTIHEPDDRQYA